MTLKELAARGDLVNRIFRAHEESKFAYRGIVAKVEIEKNCVIFSLVNYARRFEGKPRHSTWKHLQDTEIGFGGKTTIQIVDEIITFSLPKVSRIYLYPAGTKVEEMEHAPLA
ncbi:MAG: hypothetical protein WC348_03255 [Patescibacteria group bacterium]|jgi:hypothetical protein